MTDREIDRRGSSSASRSSSSASDVEAPRSARAGPLSRKRSRGDDRHGRGGKDAASREEQIDDVRQRLTAEEIALSPAAAAFLHASWRAKVTIPFLARYRQDQTGGLTEVQLRRAMTCFDDVAAR